MSDKLIILCCNTSYKLKNVNIPVEIYFINIPNAQVNKINNHIILKYAKHNEFIFYSIIFNSKWIALFDLNLEVTYNITCQIKQTVRNRYILY